MKSCQPALLLLVTVLSYFPVGANALYLHAPGGAAYSVPVSPLKERRFRNTVRQKYDFSCGAAAVATLLTYQYGHQLSEEEAFKAMFANGDQHKIRREGFSLLDIKRFLKTLGYESNAFRAGLPQLVGAGLPAIVMISEKGYQHFVVIRGFRHGRVLFSDPAMGERTLPTERFEQIWQNGLLFVIHSHQQSASFNGDAQWRSVPIAPLNVGIPRDSMFPMQRLGPGEF